MSDISPERLREAERAFGATVVSQDEIYGLDVDVFAPCALGGILNAQTIPRLKAPIVAGGANNQLEDENVHGQMVRERKITYCPDYVINAGGLINVYNELIGYDREKALGEAKSIESSIRTILQDAEKEGITTHEASGRFAERRIKAIKELKVMSSFAHSGVGRMQK